MTGEAADWGEHDLSRRFFAGRPHDEITELASVFDALLARLAEGLRREQRLTAEVSHELRTPLAKVLAEAELASVRERSPQQYRESLQLITRHARELQRVLETLLASARAEARPRGTASDARESAERAASALRATLSADGKSIELICAERVRVAVEPDVVERILSPLLENAARFARRSITLEVRRTGGDVRFEVRDDGPGVPPGERERIFEPGFRSGDRAPEQRHAGAGLGLALVRRLATAAGGDVQAQATNEGANFVVRLPAA